GIGPWTLEAISMRALGDPDAFPATDLGVVKGAAALGLPTTPATLVARSRRWQPWRSYGVQYLWATLDHPINRWRPEEPPCA
ncbi:MAG: DNA-3-methyladenine glycosylase, partial [Actinomycetota bacterium]|nr:DNA-3-methyladenine glycosylase [Actinomycetota bacterium]